MRQILVVSLLVFFSMISCSQTDTNKEITLSTANDSISYAIGIDIGKSLKKQDIEFTPEILLEGIINSETDKIMLSEEEIKAVMVNFQNMMREKRMNKNAEASKKNKEDAEAFFAENKTKEGVITLESGLQYKVQKSGTGKSPKLSNTVETHYSGRLLDGTEFDSSYKRGKPISFKVTGVIKGWTEILQLMKEGDKWEVYIPSDLAYGPRGSGQIIGPDAALIFEMELFSVK